MRILTEEEEARIVTNRQRAHYKAKTKASNEILPAKTADLPIEEQILTIRKNKAVAKKDSK